MALIAYYHDLAGKRGYRPDVNTPRTEAFDYLLALPGAPSDSERSWHRQNASRKGRMHALLNRLPF